MTRLFVALACVVSLASAQSPPPTCFGFNTASAYSDYAIVFAIASPLTVFFTAPQTVTADQVAVFEDSWSNASMRVAVHAVSPATGFVLQPALGTAPAGPFSNALGWQAKTLSPPVSMIAGTTYALVCTAVPTLTNFPGYGGPVVAASFHVDQQPTTTPLLYTGGGPNPFGTPGAAGFKFGFEGTACGPRLAELLPGGPPCGGGTPWQPLLATNASSYGGGGRPILGTMVSLTVRVGPGVPTGAQTAFFWSVGSNAAGTPLPAPSPCSHWLNPASLAILLLAGAEPLATGYWTSDGPTMVAAIPNLPSIVGTAFTIQAAIIDPAGVPSGTPGVNLRLSNSLTLVPGF